MLDRYIESLRGQFQKLLNLHFRIQIVKNFDLSCSPLCREFLWILLVLLQRFRRLTQMLRSILSDRWLLYVYFLDSVPWNFGHNVHNLILSDVKNQRSTLILQCSFRSPQTELEGLRLEIWYQPSDTQIRIYFEYFRCHIRPSDIEPQRFNS